MWRSIILFVSISMIAGCSTYATQRYSSLTDNVLALERMDTEGVAIGQFSDTAEAGTAIMCRGVGPIETPDGESFSEYIRSSLIDELRLADKYNEESDIALSGEVRQVDFSSMDGHWDLTLYLESTNGNTLTVSERYQFSTSWYGETACNQTAQAFVPAVQDLLSSVIHSDEFRLILAYE